MHAIKTQKIRLVVMMLTGFAILFSLGFHLFSFTGTKASGTAPLLTYAPANDQLGIRRQLIYVNNPEHLRFKADDKPAPSDYADQANVSIFSAKVEGAYRDYFAHISNSNVSNTGYGVRLYNNGTSSVSVVVERSGSAVAGDADYSTSKPMVEMLNKKPVSTPVSIPAKGSIWLLQMAKIPAERYFIGVVDFTVQGTNTNVRVENLAYSDATKIPTPDKIQYEGYASVGANYKGIGSSTDVLANVDFTVGSGDKDGQFMPVSYKKYKEINNDHLVPSDNLYTSNALKDESDPNAPEFVKDAKVGWYTNLSPAGAVGDPSKLPPVGSDMVAFKTPPPDNWTFDALSRTNPKDPASALYRYPNLANWGVVYTIKGTIKNTLSVPIVIYYDVAANGSNIGLLTSGTTNPWVSHTTTQALKDMRAITVPSGQQLPYSFTFTLGPSNGPIHQGMRLSYYQG